MPLLVLEKGQTNLYFTQILLLHSSTPTTPRNGDVGTAHDLLHSCMVIFGQSWSRTEGLRLYREVCSN